MSRGRHSRPRARGGGLAAFLAVAVAGGAVVVAVTKPDTAAMRLCVIGLAAVTAFGLLILGRHQSSTSRALARSEDRLRVLEQRSRDEGDELHRRVLESISREGELSFAVDVLSMEISRLRASLQGLAAPVGTLSPVSVGNVLAPVDEPYAAVAAASTASAAPVAAPAQAVPGQPSTVDIPLVQRVLVAQEAASAAAAAPAPETVPAAVPSGHPAGLAAPVPVSVPVPVDDYETTVRSWVVREVQVDAVPEPVGGLSMRILDLTSGTADDGLVDAEPQAETRTSEPRYARPA